MCVLIYNVIKFSLKNNLIIPNESIHLSDVVFYSLSKYVGTFTFKNILRNRPPSIVF